MTVLTICTFCLSLAVSLPATVVAGGGLQDTKATAAAAQEQDPICGMSVDTAKAKADKRTSEYEGKTYYFCNDSCKKQFDADPAKYAAQKKSDDATGSSAAAGGCCCMRGGMGGGMGAGAGMAGGKGTGMSGGGMCCRRMR